MLGSGWKPGQEFELHPGGAELIRIGSGIVNVIGFCPPALITIVRPPLEDADVEDELFAC
jgi:hypothetical protein